MLTPSVGADAFGESPRPSCSPVALVITFLAALAARAQRAIQIAAQVVSRKLFHRHFLDTVSLGSRRPEITGCNGVFAGIGHQRLPPESVFAGAPCGTPSSASVNRARRMRVRQIRHPAIACSAPASAPEFARATAHASSNRSPARQQPAAPRDFAIGDSLTPPFRQSDLNAALAHSIALQADLCCPRL